ncbi:MAG: response regulator [Proteobacteria bacterium]|nr:response regulator [Pseudomonadota bacterium]
MSRQSVEYPRVSWASQRSLRFWMILVFGGLSALVVISVSLVRSFGLPSLGIEGDYQSFQRREVIRLGLVADLKKELLQSWLRERLGDVSTLADDPEVQADVFTIVESIQKGIAPSAMAAMPEAIRIASRFRSTSRYYSAIEAMYLVDALSGEIIVSSLQGNLGRGPDDREQLKSIVESRQDNSFLFVGSNNNGGNRSMIIRRSVHGLDGDMHVAVLFSRIDIDAVLMPILSNGGGLGLSGEVLLTDKDRHLLTPLEQPLTDGGVASEKYRLDSLPISLASSGKEGVLFTEDYRKVPVLAAFRHVNLESGTGWGMVVKQDVAELRKAFIRRLTVSLWVGVAGVVVVFICCVAFARTLTAPLRRVTGAALRLGNGDFSQKVPQATGYREVTELTTAFEGMAGYLKEWDATLNREIAFKTEQLNNEFAERKRLMAAIEQTGEAIILTNEKGIIEYVNPAFETVSGYSRVEAVGQTSSILKSGKQDEAFYRNLWETILNGRSWQGRITNKHKDGSLYVEDAAISPVFAPSGKIVNFVAVKRDVTAHIRATEDKARLEEQLRQAQKMESIGRLAGGVAHDFNNMLGVILGYGEIVQRSLAADDPLQEPVSEIVKAGQRSAALTRQLLAFSRKQVLQVGVLSLNDVVRDLEKMLRRLIGEDIELTLSLDERLARVMADAGQIEQVVINLVVNARAAMLHGGKLIIETVNVELDFDYTQDHPGVQPGWYVMLAVSDTGCGMDKATQANIFEPFFTTKERGKGTGLGLSTVFGIVKQSGGNILVYSDPGQGTTFKIYFPQTQIEPQANDVLVAERKRSIDENLSILVVEDEAPFRKMVERMLKNLGYHQLFFAASGDEALRLVEGKKMKPDLVITDVVMPGMSGKELVARLRENRPDLKVLYVSGYTDDFIDHHDLGHPETPFLQKPFSVRQLAEKIEEVLLSG